MQGLRDGEEVKVETPGEWLGVMSAFCARIPGGPVLARGANSESVADWRRCDAAEAGPCLVCGEFVEAKHRL